MALCLLKNVRGVALIYRLLVLRLGELVQPLGPICAEPLKSDEWRGDEIGVVGEPE
jgi:hypothetical protein